MKRLLSTLALLGCLLLCSAACAETHTIVFATDMHYISPELTDHGEYFTTMIENSDGKTMQYIEEINEAFVAQMIAMQPELLVLGGDLTFNGAVKSHEDFAQKLARIEAAGIPVYVIPGNHDLNNRNAAAFTGSSYERVPSASYGDFAMIYKDFGLMEAVSRDISSLSYVAEPFSGVRLLLLDVNGNGTPGEISLDTYLWAEAQLKKAQEDGAHVICVSHQNLLPHNELLQQGFVFIGASAMEELYAAYGVHLNLSGHMHAQHIAESASGVADIATSSMAVSPCQFGVLTLDGSAVHYETLPVDVSGWALADGSTDEKLLHFADTASDFFLNSSLRQTRERFSGLENGEDAARFAAGINALYFAGRPDLTDKDAPEAAYWLHEDSAFGGYIKTVLEGDNRNSTVWDGEI